MMNASDDDSLAAGIAERAGRILMELRHHLGLADPTRLGFEGDRRSHEVILEFLEAARPGDAILSEESADRGDGRLQARRVWIVDPLDGTREFSEGRSDFAVHVALAVDHRATVGAVALPAEDVVLATVPAPLLRARHEGPPRIVVSRTRAPSEAARVAGHLDATILPMGSAGAKAMAVVRGDADIYLHAGGQYEWDSAAPTVVAAAAGLHVSRLDGSPLRYNQADPWLPDVLVCRVELADAVLDALAS
jgi:3'(2'), 5'-bisphosphate nucleotidase